LTRPLAIFVDTTAWYALMDTRDRWHTQAEEAMRELRAASRRLVTTNHIVGETYTTLMSRRHPARETFLPGLRASRTVERVFVPESWEEAAEDLLAQYQDQDFSYVDAVSFISMRRLGIEEAFAFDHHFAVAGFRVVPPLP
jgi:predicted nucleic acid-binding protein